MRRVLPFVLLLAVAACGTPSRWEKPGADDNAVVRDIGDCRQAAQREAFRYYAFNYGSPFYGAPLWGFGRRPSYFLWQQRMESDRFFTENRLAAFCMRTKGYELVPIQPPQTGAPALPEPPKEK